WRLVAEAQGRQRAGVVEREGHALGALEGDAQFGGLGVEVRELASGGVHRGHGDPCGGGARGVRDAPIVGSKRRAREIGSRSAKRTTPQLRVMVNICETRLAE